MSLADDSTAKQFQKRLALASQEINQLAPMFGLAKQVIDYDSDRRKNLLAKYARQHIQAGESATAADLLARSDPEYVAALDIQAEELRTAYATTGKWDALHVRWETGRSLLALTREQLKTMPE
jgi:hypothetical protein